MKGNAQWLCVALAATSLLGASASAQHLAITGHVTDSAGHALHRATVTLEGTQIIAQTGQDGEYLLEIPDSVARGQRANVVVHHLGSAMSALPVTLRGQRIVRNVVMPSGPAHTAGISLGSTDEISTAPDLSISGVILDSAGVGIPSVSVMLQGMALGTVTDNNGYYSFRVPRDRVTGALAKYSVRQLGYLPVDDSILLVGDSIRRDVRMSRPIYDMTAAEVLSLDGGVERAAGLTDLRRGPHPAGEREVRIRIFGGYVGPKHMYRFLNRSGAASGEVISYWNTEKDEGLLSSARSAARAKTRRCARDYRKMILPCRARFTANPDWPRLWKSLDSLGVWTIADRGHSSQARNTHAGRKLDRGRSLGRARVSGVVVRSCSGGWRGRTQEGQCHHDTA